MSMKKSLLPPFFSDQDLLHNSGYFLEFHNKRPIKDLALKKQRYSSGVLFFYFFLLTASTDVVGLLLHL
jgi:hypothetical protein